MIKQGDTVVFKKEWQEDGDEQISYIACADEDGGRVLVMALIGMSINPAQVVRTDMIVGV